MGDHARSRIPARHRKPSLQTRAAAMTAAAATGTATAGVIILASHGTAAASPASVAYSHATGVNEVGIIRTEEEAVINARQAYLRHLAHLAHLAHLRYLASVKKEKAQQVQMVSAVSNSVPRASFAPGVFSFAALRALWVSAGGPSWAANTAACIAMHESGGRSWVVSPTNDVGLWQINRSHGALASFDPMLNAEAAVQISSHGTNWGPWTTAPMCGV